ncbi:ribonuclease P protein component, partial [Chloroflexota bacterium]
KGEQYLTKADQFALVYNRGRSWASSLLVIKATSNGLDLSRYGFSVSKRIGNAVIRNRTKRLLRELLRKSSLKPGWDIVFVARHPFITASYQELEKEVTTLLTRASIRAEEEDERSSPGND